MFVKTTIHTDSYLPANLVIYEPETVKDERKWEFYRYGFLQGQVLPDHDADPVVCVRDGVLAMEQTQGLGDRLVRVVGGVQQPVDGLQLVFARDAVGQVTIGHPLPIQLWGRHLGSLLLHLILLVGNVLESLRSLTVNQGQC